RRFGSKTVLNDVSLAAPRGSVFGLVGENGAGKTTLVKHILGLLRAEAGSVRVFGMDPVADPVSVLGRIGYLSEQPDLPGWMRVDELIRYTQAFYPKWDAAYAEEMREQFGLDPAARVRVLSKGQRAKLGLLAAQAHRPDLLLLDEPSSGLDPIRFETQQHKPPMVPGALTVTGTGREWTIICNYEQIELPAITAKLGASIVDEHEASLNDIFVANA
ncbi:MAG: ABC transporter ATP-binding protein, partial [Verrucomicrobia bacterium RIFCSPLOWO2_12_FULL_64_8]